MKVLAERPGSIAGLLICLIVLAECSQSPTAPPEPGPPVDTGKLRSPSNGPRTSVAQYLDYCPTAVEVEEIRADWTLRYLGDPTAPALVCTEEEGSADLTFLQSRVVQALLITRGLELSSPLPWTDLPLYDWLRQAVNGMEFRDDIRYSACCSREGLIYVRVSETMSVINEDLEAWESMMGFLALVIHEARHNEFGGHTCPPCDNTVEELGSWGVQYQFYQWIAAHSDPTFIPNKYDDAARENAHNLLITRFCQEPEGDCKW